MAIGLDPKNFTKKGLPRKKPKKKQKPPDRSIHVVFEGGPLDGKRQYMSDQTPDEVLMEMATAVYVKSGMTAGGFTIYKFERWSHE